jgi:galactokinase/mevalonate kinase-like predicted kinase
MQKRHPYSDLYGGMILNATINLNAYYNIEETGDNKIRFYAPDIDPSKSVGTGNSESDMIFVQKTGMKYYYSIYEIIWKIIV